MPNLNRRHGGARGDGGPGSLLWLAVLGAACIVAVPLLLVSSYNGELRPPRQFVVDPPLCFYDTVLV